MKAGKKCFLRMLLERISLGSRPSHRLGQHHQMNLGIHHQLHKNLFGLPSNGSQVGRQLGRRLAVENTPSHQMRVSMLQQVAPQQDTSAQSGATALHSVESTIAELEGFLHTWPQ